jgi:hypothetical protein
VDVRSVFGEEPDDKEAQEALRKQQRRLDEEDRMHRRMVGIRSPEELAEEWARNLWQEHRGEPMPEEVVRDLQERLRRGKPNR